MFTFEIFLGSRKLLTTSNVNTTTSLLNNPALNATLVSGTTESMRFFILFLQLATRKRDMNNYFVVLF